MKKKNKKTDAYEAQRTFAKGSILTVLLTVLVFAIIGGTWWFLDYTKDDGLIYPNVYAFGVDLGGKTPEEAAAAIEEATADTFYTQSMTVQLPDCTLTLAPEQTGAGVDAQAIAQLAFAYGRGGNRWENTQAKAAAALDTYYLDTRSCMTLNVDAIRAAVDAAAAKAASTLTQPTVSVTGEVPDRNLSYKAAQEKTDVVHQKLTIVLGTPDRSLNVDALMETILSAYSLNDFTPIAFAYDVVEPNAPDLDALYAQYYIAPVDAVLNETDYSITHEILGYGFDLEALKAMVAHAGEGQTVTADFAYVPAALTWEANDATLFKDVLGCVTS